MPDGRVAATFALAAPLCIVTIALSSVAIGERADATFFTARAPSNLAEAAASARADLVVRFLRAGHDPSHVYPIHPEVISSAVRHATALEAAIWSRQVELIELIDRTGGIPDEASRRALTCLADDLGVDEIVDYLSRDGAEPCVPEQAVKAVIARTAAAGDR